jgi:hypothetical protein
MSTLTLTCPRTRTGRPLHSVHPWRLLLQHDDGRVTPLSYNGWPLAFRRQRDGGPVLTALAALGLDWQRDPTTWLDTEREAVADILDATAEYQAWQAVCAAVPRAPGGPRC